MSRPLNEILSHEPTAAAEDLADAELTDVKYYRGENRAELYIHAKKPLSFANHQGVIGFFEQAAGIRVSMFVESEKEEIQTAELMDYLHDFYRTFTYASLFRAGLPSYLEKEHTLEFVFASEPETNEADQYLSYLKDYFETIGLKELKLACRCHVPEESEIPELEVIMPAAPKQEAQRPQNNEQRKKFRRPKKEEFKEISLKDVQDGMRDVRFDAEVFNKEETIIKSSERTIQMLSVFDGEDAIIVKRFESARLTKEELDAAKVGGRYRFYGYVQYDTFSKDIVFMADEVEELPGIKIEDTAEEKRVELHCHTNMSEMDAVCEPDKVVKYAFDLGHEGICITDHADVQSFVKAFNTGASLVKKSEGKRQFKVGLGCEVNLADDRLNIVYNPCDLDLEKAEYVVFDLETTGLSCYYDHIIEFGAVRIKNNTIIDRKQMFIKPPVPIPSVITAKTNITNDMVRNARSIAEEIDGLTEWIGDAVLVAHNASFDYSFLNEERRRLGKPKLPNTVIDTLDLSRAVLKDRRAYRLGNISRYYHIAYDEEVAHRADYDAEALAGVFLCLVKDAKKMGAVTIRDLQEKTQDDEAYKKVRRSHTILMAKNKQGLHDLYHLVTLSNTVTLAVFSKNAKEGAEVAAEPRVLRSAVNKVRENLLIGSSCQNNELFELACNREDDQLEKAMRWYDYIELQPLDCYTTYVALGNVPDMERIKDVQRRLIRMADKLGIPVVADSDAHYCKPSEKIFRDVYIMSNGVGGASHPLYIRDDALRQRTKNPDQHIRLTQEMLDAFSWLNDDALVHKIVIENPHKIFSMLDEIRPVPSGTYPPTIEGSDDKLREICHETAKRMYEFEGKVPDVVMNRLDEELDNIIRNGFGVHYYIAHLLVKRSNDDGYLVGSRGSVGSSFTATMSGITEVNSLKPHYLCPQCHYSEWIEDPTVSSGFDLPDKVCPHCGATMKGNGHNIPFQTFLGFNADKTPDIDLNFSNEYQAKAHAFIKEVFGEDHAFRAGTIGTVAEKTAYGYVSGYCEKMNIPNMRRPMRDYLAKGCQNVKRTTGQHPGGIIIIPEAYTAEDFTPVQYPANDPTAEWKTTHYDFHDIHDNVLKFDILGHVDPTAMRLLTNISKTNPLTIPMNDPETLSLFYCDDALKADPRVYHKETGALGLPEFGTKITRHVLEQTRPHIFSDLTILSGLTHGTDVYAGNAETLIQEGHSLKEVIGCRDDIMTYLLGKNLKPIDAFKIMEDVRKGRGLKPEQEATMKEHDVPDWYIWSCKKIKYMFPKAHAVAYVMMAVRIAWYKVHEPWNFYIQFFTLRCDAYEIETMSKGLDVVRNRMKELSEKMKDRFGPNAASNKEKSLYDTLEVCEELYARGYSISNVDLYRSKATEFSADPNDNHVIIPPFTVIDGLGANVARSIEEARRQGPFLSKEDIIKRTQLSSTMVKKLELLGCIRDMQETNQMSLF